MRQLFPLCAVLVLLCGCGQVDTPTPAPPPTIAPTVIPTVAPTATLVPTATATVDLAPTQTRTAELVQLATLTAPTATATARPSPTPSPAPTLTPKPTPTFWPTPTVAPAQMTAETIRAKQQAAWQATALANQQEACARIDAVYASVGRTFNRLEARGDLELALIEFRIVKGGTGERPLGRVGQFAEDLDRQTLYRCLGLPDPPIRYP